MIDPLDPHAFKVSKVEEVFEDLRKAGKSDEEIFETVYLELKQLARKMLTGDPLASACTLRGSSAIFG